MILDGSNGFLLNSAVAVCAELLSVGCGGAAGEQADHSRMNAGRSLGWRLVTQLPSSTIA